MEVLKELTEDHAVGRSSRRGEVGGEFSRESRRIECSKAFEVSRRAEKNSSGSLCELATGEKEGTIHDDDLRKFGPR